MSPEGTGSNGLESRRLGLKFKHHPEWLTTFSKVTENLRASVSSGVLRLDGSEDMGVPRC